MAYPTGIAPFWTENMGGLQPVLNVETTQLHPLGTIARAQDATLGALELIYLKGLAATAAGDVVTYDPKGAVIVRGVATSRGLVAVAMAAVVASRFGWFAIGGVVPVAAATVAANKPCFWTATPGTIDDAVVATDKIEGLITQAADSAGFAFALLDRPSANGNG